MVVGVVRVALVCGERLVFPGAFQSIQFSLRELFLDILEVIGRSKEQIVDDMCRVHPLHNPLMDQIGV